MADETGTEWNTGAILIVTVITVQQIFAFTLLVVFGITLYLGKI
jgi:hypothetical protein